MGALYQAGPNALLTFLFLTVLLGGAAAMAAGRALARTWRPAWYCLLYALPIAVTIAFLHYALFQEPVIPAFSIAAALARLYEQPLAALAEALFELRGVSALFVVHALFAVIVYRLTRRRQMACQYGFTRNGAPAREP